jgi:hypothetical protein
LNPSIDVFTLCLPLNSQGEEKTRFRGCSSLRRE